MHKRLFSTSVTPKLERKNRSKKIRLILSYTNEIICGNYCSSEHVFYPSDKNINHCYHWNALLGYWYYVDESESDLAEETLPTLARFLIYVLLFLCGTLPFFAVFS